MGLCRCDQLSEQVPGAVETRARGRVGLRKGTGDLHGHSRIEVHRLCAGVRGGGAGRCGGSRGLCASYLPSSPVLAALWPPAPSPDQLGQRRHSRPPASTAPARAAAGSGLTTA